MRNHRITISVFRPCSAGRPHSQARFCYCALRPVTKRTERTFESLRYSFGGDHPSQTTQQPLFPVVPGLGTRHGKGGISTSTPRRLASPVQRLPPMLHVPNPAPTATYSKGARGLSVPWRVLGIFTETTISPSSRLRQRPNRYTIRAGRNLPDKVFRYLRTVIVTAAVYRGFDSNLRTVTGTKFPS